MFAIIADGGKQYRVEKGQILCLELRAGNPGDTVEFKQVLFIEDGKDVRIGRPTVTGASVRGKVLGEVKGPKVIVHHFRPRAGYRNRIGHRQRYTRVEIESIEG